MAQIIAWRQQCAFLSPRRTIFTRARASSVWRLVFSSLLNYFFSFRILIQIVVRFARERCVCVCVHIIVVVVDCGVCVAARNLCQVYESSSHCRCPAAAIHTSAVWLCVGCVCVWMRRVVVENCDMSTSRQHMYTYTKYNTCVCICKQLAQPASTFGCCVGNIIIYLYIPRSHHPQTHTHTELLI